MLNKWYTHQCKYAQKPMVQIMESADVTLEGKMDAIKQNYHEVEFEAEACKYISKHVTEWDGVEWQEARAHFADHGFASPDLKDTISNFLYLCATDKRLLIKGLRGPICEIVYDWVPDMRAAFCKATGYQLIHFQDILAAFVEGNTDLKKGGIAALIKLFDKDHTIDFCKEIRDAVATWSEDEMKDACKETGMVDGYRFKHPETYSAESVLTMWRHVVSLRVPDLVPTPVPAPTLVPAEPAQESGTPPVSQVPAAPAPDSPWTEEKLKAFSRAVGYSRDTIILGELKAIVRGEPNSPFISDGTRELMGIYGETPIDFCKEIRDAWKSWTNLGRDAALRECDHRTSVFLEPQSYSTDTVLKVWKYVVSRRPAAPLTPVPAAPAQESNPASQVPAQPAPDSSWPEEKRRAFSKAIGYMHSNIIVNQIAEVLRGEPTPLISGATKELMKIYGETPVDFCKEIRDAWVSWTNVEKDAALKEGDHRTSVFLEPEAYSTETILKAWKYVVSRRPAAPVADSPPAPMSQVPAAPAPGSLFPWSKEKIAGFSKAAGYSESTITNAIITHNKDISPIYHNLKVLMDIYDKDPSIDFCTEISAAWSKWDLAQKSAAKAAVDESVDSWFEDPVQCGPGYILAMWKYVVSQRQAAPAADSPPAPASQVPAAPAPDSPFIIMLKAWTKDKFLGFAKATGYTEQQVVNMVERRTSGFIKLEDETSELMAIYDNDGIDFCEEINNAWAKWDANQRAAAKYVCSGFDCPRACGPSGLLIMWKYVASQVPAQPAPDSQGEEEEVSQAPAAPEPDSLDHLITLSAIWPTLTIHDKEILLGLLTTPSFQTTTTTIITLRMLVSLMVECTDPARVKLFESFIKKL